MPKHILIAYFVVCFILAAPAAAVYSATPHSGDRAPEVIGQEMHTGKPVSLDVLAGSWVLIVFWNTGCAPCKRLIDNELAALSAGEHDNLEIVLIDLDTESQRNAALDILSEKMLDVTSIFGRGLPLFVGLTDADQPGSVSDMAREWNVRGVPATFLLDPQGNVVAQHLRGSSLIDICEYYLSLDPVPPPIGLRTSYSVQGDGMVELLVDVSSPDRIDLEVKVDYVFYTLERDGSGKPIYRGHGEKITNPGKGVPEYEYTADCRQGQTVESVMIDCRGFDGLSYRVQVKVPGTDDLNGGKGIWLRQGGEIYLNFPEHSREFSG